MPDIMKKIIELIRNSFPNGIRDDFIDTNKVARIYPANYEDEDISRSFIADIIHANGIEDGGRFYFISDEDIEKILRLVNEVSANNSIIYYRAFQERHAEFFVSLHIFSPEVLKKVLRKVDVNHFYFSEFFSTSRATRLDYEVSKIFMATGKSLSLEDLQEKLPYVPTEKISTVLADEKKYLTTNAGKYLSVSKIQFDTEEINTAKQQISFHIDANGYAMPEDYNLSSNFALNPELTEKDLLNVIYEKFFSADFTRRGKKLFKKGAVIKEKRSTTPTKSLRKFLAEQDELSDEKLFAFAETLGFTQKQITAVLLVAHETLTRVAKNLFVRDSLISFDIAGVDEALASFVQGKIIPLRGVTSFTGFPPVEGYSWNLFMLESFLRKYSEKYTYATPAANNSNVGAIYPKSMKFEDYLDVQVAAVIQEKIPLTQDSVEEFLVGQGFRANRLQKTTARILTAAQEISR